MSSKKVTKNTYARQATDVAEPAMFPGCFTTDQAVPMDGTARHYSTPVATDYAVSLEEMAFFTPKPAISDNSVPMERRNFTTTNPHMTDNAVPMPETTPFVANPSTTNTAIPTQEPASSCTGDAFASMTETSYAMLATVTVVREMKEELANIRRVVTTSQGAMVNKDELAGPLLRVNQLAEGIHSIAQESLTKVIIQDNATIRAQLQAAKAKYEQLLQAHRTLIETEVDFEGRIGHVVDASDFHQVAFADPGVNGDRIGANFKGLRQRIAVDEENSHSASAKSVETAKQSQSNRFGSASSKASGERQGSQSGVQVNTPEDAHSNQSETSPRMSDTKRKTTELKTKPAAVPTTCITL